MGKYVYEFKKRIRETQLLEIERHEKLHIVDMLHDGYSMPMVASLTGLSLVEVRAIDNEYGARR